MLLELNSKLLYQSSGKERESCCPLFPSSTKCEFRHIHVVVAQRRQRNVQKSVMHVQSCCFANLTFCFFFFCLSRCSRRRRCYAVSPSIHRFLSNRLKMAGWGIQIVATTFIAAQSVIILILLLLISHFRVPKTVTFKMRLVGAQPFL